MEQVKKSNLVILSKNIGPLLIRILKNNRAIGEAYRIVNFKNLDSELKLIYLIKNTWGFLLKLDKNRKDIAEIEYVWENIIADEFDFMKMLAPFVEKNS